MFQYVFVVSTCNCLLAVCLTLSIGYPVVYLGFDATCYFSSIFKMRTQKAVQNENDFHVHLLQQSLPPGLQFYPKSVTDSNGSKYRAQAQT